MLREFLNLETAVSEVVPKDALSSLWGYECKHSAHDNRTRLKLSTEHFRNVTVFPCMLLPKLPDTLIGRGDALREHLSKFFGEWSGTWHGL